MNDPAQAHPFNAELKFNQMEFMVESDRHISISLI
jgi:hypothetical protein